MRRTESGKRPHDHAFVQQRVDTGATRHRRSRRRGSSPPRRAQARARARAALQPSRSRPSALSARRRAISAGSPRLASAATCAGLVRSNGRRSLGHRGADVARCDRVADTQAGEAVDLGEGPQDERPAARASGSARPRRDSRGARCTRSRPGRRRTSTCAGSRSKKPVELRGRVHRAGRVVGVADVDELRPRRDRRGDRVEVVAAARAAAPSPRRALLGARRSGSSETTASRRRSRRPGRASPGSGCRGSRRRPHPAQTSSNATPCRRASASCEPDVAAVGIAVELASRSFDRFDRSRERRKRPFVRRELDDPLEAELALHVLDRLAGLVRRRCPSTTGRISGLSLAPRKPYGKGFGHQDRVERSPSGRR